MMRTRYLFFTWIMLFFYSCVSNNERLERYDFESEKTPILGILTYDNEYLEYDTYFVIFLKDTSAIEQGKTFSKNNSLFGYFNEPKSNTFKIFDFKMQPGQVDTIRIEFEYKDNETKTFNFVVKCEDLITDYIDQEVRKIIIEDYFGYHPDYPDGEISYYDLVAFITTKNGVIGSYLQDINEDQLIYLVPRGDILESVYDYSEMEKRVFK